MYSGRRSLTDCGKRNVFKKQQKGPQRASILSRLQGRNGGLLIVVTVVIFLVIGGTRNNLTVWDFNHDCINGRYNSNSQWMGLDPATMRLRAKPINKPLPPLSKMPSTVEEALQMISDARSKDKSRATFVQIGANDGIMNDPLYASMKDQKHKWIGLQVEPQPELYSSLAVLHAADAPDWAFYHGALASPEACPNGTISFCETKTPGEGDWTTQGQVNRIANHCSTIPTMHMKTRPCITSFEKLIYYHASPVFLKYVMEEVEVDLNHEKVFTGKSPQSVSPDESNEMKRDVLRLPRNGLAAQKEDKDRMSLRRKFNIDFLQIDVEGNDFDVLTLVNWESVKPVCVRYEINQLRVEREEAIAEARILLQNLGYTYTEDPMDAFACQVVEAKH